MADEITTYEASAMLDIHPTTIVKYCSSGLLVARKHLNGKWIINKRSAEILLKKGLGEPQRVLQEHMEVLQRYCLDHPLIKKDPFLVAKILWVIPLCKNNNQVRELLGGQIPFSLIRKIHIKHPEVKFSEY